MYEGPVSKNIRRECSLVSSEERYRRMGHQGAVLWFTGLSGAGKSTLAYALEAQLFRMGCAAYVLDGDNVRHGLNLDLGFCPEDRSENIRRVAEVANLFADAGVIVSAAFISPYIRDRERAREVCCSNFVEVHLSTPLDVCEDRDPKGLYWKARTGEIPNFTGVSAPYECPPEPELLIDTSVNDIPQSVALLVGYLRSRGILRKEAQLPDERGGRRADNQVQMAGPPQS